MKKQIKYLYHLPCTKCSVHMYKLVDLLANCFCIALSSGINNCLWERYCLQAVRSVIDAGKLAGRCNSNYMLLLDRQMSLVSISAKKTVRGISRGTKDVTLLQFI